MEIGKIIATVKKAKGLLETEHLRLQQEKTSFQEFRASYVAQPDEQKQNNNLVAAPKDAEQQLKTEHLQWQEEKSSLLGELEKFRGIYLAQVEMQEEENKAFAAVLKEAEEQAAIGLLQWQQQKTSLMDELEELEKSRLQHDEQKMGKQHFEKGRLTVKINYLIILYQESEAKNVFTFLI